MKTRLFLLAICCIVTHVGSFEKASPRYQLSFPRDHGPHPSFKTEWWYFTGNVKDAVGREFGYQLTFFRNSVRPLSQVKKRTSAWATSEFIMAHAAISDVKNKTHVSEEKISRAIPGLAHAQAFPMKIFLENWSMEGDLDKKTQLKASSPAFVLDLDLENEKPKVLHGKNGFSQKGRSEENASMYYSYTKLRTKGTLTLNGQVHAVEGYSWMDHEFSTSILEKEQVGWDWFSIQMEDGTELMLFKLRNQAKETNYGNGTFVKSDGRTVSLEKDDFVVEEKSTWTSNRTKGVYPVAWNIKVPKLKLDMDVSAKFLDQEMKTSVSYWEGSVRVSAKRDQRQVQGEGYVEMTGYAQPIKEL